MTNQTKIVLYFGAVILAMHIASTVIAIARSRNWTDRRAGLFYVIWKQISTTLIILGALLALVIQSNPLRQVGLVLAGLGLVLLLVNFTYGIIYQSRHRNK